MKISFWFKSIIFLTLEISIPGKSLKKKYKIALGYPIFYIKKEDDMPF